ncbi:MAG TPA: IS66 family insertion sequence element accessory protein TnpB [Planktothrix sp.]|jgi:transposase
MLNLLPSTKIFVCKDPVDMRKSFDALAGLIHSYFGENPLSGHLFVFFSKNNDRMKILFWQLDGFVLYYKRLEGGTFTWSEFVKGAEAEIFASDFELLLAGINPSTGAKQKRYERVPANVR